MPDRSQPQIEQSGSVRRLCGVCNERSEDHPTTNECHRCLQRRWMAENPHHNRRDGKRAEQKRAWDRKAAAKRKAEREAMDRAA